MNNEKKNKDKLEHSLKLLVKSSIIVFIGVIFSKIFTYAHRVIIARYYGPEIYGLFSLSVIILGWFLAFSSLGLSEGLLRYIPIYRGKNNFEKIKHIFKITINFTLFSGIIAGLMLFFLADFIALKFFNSPDLAIFLKIFGVIAPVALFSNLFSTILRAFEKISSYSFVVNILQTGTNLLMLIIFIFFGLNKNNSVALSYSSGFLIVFFISYFLCKYNSLQIFGKYYLNAKIKKEAIKEFFSYSWPLMFSAIVVNLFNWVDSLTIGYFKNIENVGFYNAAVPIVSLLSIFPGLFMQLFFPLITKEYSKKNFEVIKQISKQVTKWAFILNLPLFLIIFIFPGAIINILFGEEYLVAQTPLMILSFGGFLYSFCAIFTNLISMMGKSKLILINLVLATFFNLFLNIIFVPKYGMIGAAFSTVIVFIILTAVLLLEVRHYTKIVPIKMEFLRISLISAIPVILLIYIKQYISMNLFNIFLLIFSFLLLYLFLIFISGCLNKNDIMIIKAIKNKLLKNSVP